jgi:L-threonylcarbamoyladenylate synthase
MKTLILKIDKNKPDTDKLRQVAEVLKSGGVAVIPTDTVYGLAAGVFETKAQKRIFALKGRSYRKPLILMPRDTASFRCIAEMPEQARKLAGKFWPGPLTLVLPVTELGKLVSGGRADIGVRIPDSKLVLALVKLCGFPLLTTSANPSDKPSAKTGAQAEKYFKGKADVIINAGSCALGRESSVVGATHFHCNVIREGCISSKDLEKCL